MDSETTNITIRRTEEADWLELKAIRLAALSDAPLAFGVSHATALTYTDQQWRERASGRGPATYLLAYASGQAVGMAAGVLDSAAQFNLIAMWVAPPFRGTAAAARLVGAVKAHAAAQGHARIVLGVAPDNARAVSLYQKAGFEFLPEWEALESHPHVRLQKMAWTATSDLATAM